jgi:hypothetical protein
MIVEGASVEAFEVEASALCSALERMKTEAIAIASAKYKKFDIRW